MRERKRREGREGMKKWQHERKECKCTMMTTKTAGRILRPIMKKKKIKEEHNPHPPSTNTTTTQQQTNNKKKKKKPEKNYKNALLIIISSYFDPFIYYLSVCF